MHPHAYIVISAGGSGTRLWPMSRKAKPKQFLTFWNNQSLLQHTYEQACRAVPSERVIVLTTQGLVGEVCNQLPTLDPTNLLTEPTGKNTGPSVALAAESIYQRDPEAIMVTLWADHIRTNADRFIAIVHDAITVVEQHPDAIVMMGIPPRHPETGLGYIHQGKRIRGFDTLENSIFAVQSFKEKPDEATAKRYVASGEYLWNSGYSVARAQTLLDAFKAYEPALLEQVRQYCKTRSTTTWDAILPIAVDYAIMERYPRMYVIPSEIGWHEVGTWTLLRDFLKMSHPGSSVTEGNCLTVDSHNNLILGHKRLIATAGLQNTIVVDTDDALLICQQDNVHQLKEILQQLTEQGKREYL